MRISILLFILLGFSCLSYTQRIDDEVAHYSFDDCNNIGLDELGGPNASVLGDTSCVCGVLGNALEFRSAAAQMIFFAEVNTLFTKRDFSMSFYFKPTVFSGTRHIFNKKVNCVTERVFDISFQAASGLVNVDLIENGSLGTTVFDNLPQGKCWQHIVVVRAGGTLRLYINGTLASERSIEGRVDVTNSTVLTVNQGLCDQIGELPFIGMIDEVRLFRRALNQDDIDRLYFPAEQLIPNDTIIFLGNSLEPEISSTCATRFQWRPDLEIDDSSSPGPVITPTTSRTYMLEMADDICAAFDTMRVTVIDPADLDCNEVFLPSAFTPNGDNLNDSYGLSNAEAIQNLISLEIFDQWGSRVFFTDDPFQKWDGTFDGEALNPGVFLYRVEFGCDGEDKVQVGSLTIIR